MSKTVILAAVALCAVAEPSAAALDEIVVIVNKDNDVTELSPEQLEAIFTMSRRQWSGGSSIAPFNYEPGNQMRVEFDRIVLHRAPEAIGRFWTDQRIRTGVHPPKQVNDPSLALRLTARIATAIAYVPAGIANSSVKIVARIRDGKLLGPSAVKLRAVALE